jgi:hypothetical protein
MSRWARAALFAVGCGHAAPAPAPPPGTTHAARSADAGFAAETTPPKLEDDLPRLAERAVAMFQAWQRALADANEDCAAATGKLNQLAIEYADVIDANSRVVHAGHDKIKQLRAELAKYDEQMDAAAEAIAHSKTMSNCAADPSFARAIDRIGGEPP